MKTLISLFALTLLVATLGFAQSGGSAPATATFDVGTPMTVVAGLAGNFGQLAPGTLYTIAADGAISPLDVTGADYVFPLDWTITGQPGANVEITFGLPQYFTEISGAGARVPYTVNSQSAGWAGAPFQGGGVPYTPIDPRVPNSVTLLAGGTSDVQLGGILSVPLGASGTYEAQFVLTAAYTGL